MRNLKLIDKTYSKKIIIIFFFIFYSQLVYSSDNQIIFKINDNVYTSLDIKKRIQYLDFVGSNSELDRKTIIDDFISANLFYEYYNRNLKKRDNSKKINDIYDNILSINAENKKKYTYEIDKENIISNIKIDFVRKNILENILNSSLNNLNTSPEEIDLLYKIKIIYINFNNTDFSSIKIDINNLKKISVDSLISILDNKNIDYFIKEKEINNINNIDSKIRNNILSNKRYFIIDKDNNKSFIFIKKKFETFNGVNVHIFSVRSKKELSKKYLKCDNISELKNSPNISNKEYKLSNLNNELKNNLINIDDYVKYINNNENTYIVLCNIKFDKEILKNINLNKIINSNVSEIENKFINKYSKIYNLIKLNV